MFSRATTTTTTRSKKKKLRRNGTRPAPFERRAPTAEYRSFGNEVLAYISHPIYCSPPVGACSTRASNRDPPRFLLSIVLDQILFITPGIIIIVHIPSNLSLSLSPFPFRFTRGSVRRGSDEAPPRSSLLITGRTVKWNEIVERERTREIGVIALVRVKSRLETTESSPPPPPSLTFSLHHFAPFL